MVQNLLYTPKPLKTLREEREGPLRVCASLERLRLVNAKAQSGLRRARSETCNNILRDFRIIQKHAAKQLKRRDWENRSVHDLRRTYGTRMADVVPIHALQHWMGHSDIQITARFYLGQTEGHAEKARGVFLPKAEP